MLEDLWISALILLSIASAGECSHHGSNSSSKDYLLLDEDHLLRGRFIGEGKRGPKFLSFNTVDDDIVVEMQLSVPFLTIPVKKTMDMATGMMNKIPSANVNLASIGLAGAVIFGSVFILPAIIKLMNVEHIHQGTSFFNLHHYGAGKNENDEQSSNTMERLSRALNTHGAPPADCIQRVICTLVRRASSAKKQTSGDKIVDGLASNEWIRHMLSGTFLSNAIAAGYENAESCSSKYSKCKVNQDMLHNLAKFLSKT